MSTLKMLFGGFIAALVAVIGAFSLGQFRGSRRAQADAERQRSEEQTAAAIALAQRRVEVTKGASDVQQSLGRLSDNDIDSELREKWRRPGGG